MSGVTPLEFESVEFGCFFILSLLLRYTLLLRELAAMLEIVVIMNR
jgi:hypothetical protein